MTDAACPDVEIRPFPIEISQDDLDDLRDHLARTRWPIETPGASWERALHTANPDWELDGPCNCGSPLCRGTVRDSYRRSKTDTEATSPPH